MMWAQRVKTLGLQLGLGIALGIALSRTGFSDWGAVHAMFRFSDWQLLMAFCTAVALLTPLWWVLGRKYLGALSPRPIHPGSVPGALLFGAGWLACPLQ